MLTIAILSLIGFMLGIVKDLYESEQPHLRPFIGAIMVISWWTICFPCAIIFLIIACIWAGICWVNF